MTDKKLKIEFAPGCFDQFDGTQEELDELIRSIEASVDSGEFFSESIELTDETFQTLSDEDQQMILTALNNDGANVRQLQ